MVEHKHLEGDSSQNLLDYTEEQIIAAQKTGDRGERELAVCVLLEEITGKGMNANHSEYVKEANRLEDENCAAALDVIIDEINELIAEMKESSHERIALENYRKMARESLDEIQPDEKVPHVQEEEESEPTPTHSAYEMDYGEQIVPVPLSGNEQEATSGYGLERAYLYPKGYFLPTITKNNRDVMLADMRKDKRDRRVKDEEIIDEALMWNPYSKEPWKPKTKWLSNVLFGLQEEFGLFEENVNYEKMQQYLYLVPCVTTKADNLRGTDCLAVYIDPETGERTVVTIDLSLNVEEKLYQGFSADLLVSPRGAYVHSDCNLRELQDLYTVKGNRKLDADKAKERRIQIGNAIARILKRKIREKEEGHRLHHFRLPGEKMFVQKTVTHTQGRLHDVFNPGKSFLSN